MKNPKKQIQWKTRNKSCFQFFRFLIKIENQVEQNGKVPHIGLIRSEESEESLADSLNDFKTKVSEACYENKAVTQTNVQFTVR